MQRARLMLAATLVLTAVAGVIHYTVGDAAGAYVSALPLILVAPIIAIGCDSLRGRLSASKLGIVQSAFGNIAEFALTLLALRANLPEVVRIAIAGSILGNALLLGGIAGLSPTLRSRAATSRASGSSGGCTPASRRSPSSRSCRSGYSASAPVQSSGGRRGRTSRWLPASGCC